MNLPEDYKSKLEAVEVKSMDKKAFTEQLEASQKDGTLNTFVATVRANGDAEAVALLNALSKPKSKGSKNKAIGAFATK